MTKRELKESKAWIEWFTTHASPDSMKRLSLFAQGIIKKESPCNYYNAKSIIVRVIEPDKGSNSGTTEGDMPIWGNYE